MKWTDPRVWFAFAQLFTVIILLGVVGKLCFEIALGTVEEKTSFGLGALVAVLTMMAQIMTARVFSKDFWASMFAKDEPQLPSQS